MGSYCLFDAPSIIFLLSTLSHCKTLLQFQTVGETSRWFCCLKPEGVLTKYVTSFKSKKVSEEECLSLFSVAETKHRDQVI